MLVIGLGLSLFGLGFFCWLLFTLAVYALPFFIGLTLAFAAYHSGADGFGATIIAVLAGGATLAIGRIPFATTRSPLQRMVFGLLYAVPAAVAGYQLTLGLAQIGVPSGSWREALAVVGGILVGSTGWLRMAVFATVGIGGQAGMAPGRLLTSSVVKPG
jgi:hypothetical protein